MVNQDAICEDDHADEGHKSAGKIDAFCERPSWFVDLTTTGFYMSSIIKAIMDAQSRIRDLVCERLISLTGPTLHIYSQD